MSVTEPPLIKFSEPSRVKPNGEPAGLLKLVVTVEVIPEWMYIEPRERSVLIRFSDIYLPLRFC